jgi:hypothetical protein
MFRKLACLLVVVCVGGLALAQPKDKDKDKTPKTKAKVVAVDVKKNLLTVEINGKKQEFTVSKDVKISGPKGGKANIKDDRLKAGATVGLVLEGGKLKEVWLPFREKTKDKGKKEKDKEKKDK